jgi:hypothetical protein
MDEEGNTHVEEEWITIQTKENRFTTDLDNMQFGLTLDQDTYLESMIYDFKTDATTVGTPKHVWIDVCFTTMDLASLSHVEDCVVVKVVSSGENEAERCDF